MGEGSPGRSPSRIMRKHLQTHLETEQSPNRRIQTKDPNPGTGDQCAPDNSSDDLSEMLLQLASVVSSIKGCVETPGIYRMSADNIRGKPKP